MNYERLRPGYLPRQRREARFVCMELRAQETTLACTIGKILKGSVIDNSHVLNSCICSTFQAGIYLLIYKQYVPAIASGYQSCEVSLSTPNQASAPSCHQGWLCSQKLVVKLLCHQDAVGRVEKT